MTIPTTTAFPMCTTRTKTMQYICIVFVRVDDYTDYYGIPYVYYTDEDYADILEEEQLRLEESWQAPESLAASPMELLPRLPEEGRSSFARGRALTFDVADNQGEKKAEEMLEIIMEEAEKEELEEVAD